MEAEILSNSICSATLLYHLSAEDLLREVAQARKYGISHGSLIAAIGAS